jgi:hypothetical protein
VGRRLAMSDGPYRSLAMSRRWKIAAKCAYVPAFATSEIAEALRAAIERDCRAELSPCFLGKVSRLIVGPDDPGLFRDLPVADLRAMHAQASSPMEASFLRNAVDALNDGCAPTDALQQAAEGTVSDRLLAGFRQVEEHMFREAHDQRARAVRSRLEGAHGEIDISAVARQVLRTADAPQAPAVATYSGLDDGVPL